MANVKVYNTQTGQTLSIPEDQVRFMSAQWKTGIPPKGLTDSQIKFLYKEAGLPVPDVDWVRTNLPTTENELKNVLRQETAKIRGQAAPPDAITPGEVTPPPTGVGVDTGELVPPTTELDEASRTRIVDYINGLGLTKTETDFLVATFVNKDNYTSGQTIPTNEQIGQWITDAATLAEADISPYYTRITGEELSDYKRSMAEIRARSQEFQTQQEGTYKQKLLSIKQQLRARGLTYGGTAIKRIGAEAAVRAPTGYEGTLQEARRLGYEQSQRILGAEAAGISTLAERRLGTPAITGVLGEVGRLTAPADLSGLSRPLYTPTGQYVGAGVMAPTIEQEEAAAIEASKQARLRRYALTI